MQLKQLRSLKRLGTAHDSYFRIEISVGFQLFLAAVLLRVAVFVTASHHYHIPLSVYANKGDGESYLAYARAILGDSSSLTEYHRRVFPGYPALIAVFHLVGFSFPFAALFIDWLSAGVATAAAHALFNKKREPSGSAAGRVTLQAAHFAPPDRVAWAMLFLLPHYLGNSSLAMSEAPLLAFTLVGLLLSFNNKPILGGIFLGFAGLIRPMACFAALGLIVTFIFQRNWRRMIFTALPAAAVVLIGILALHHFTGDAFHGVKVYRDSPQAYEGRIFQWPFYSLITTPQREHFSAGFITYIYIHVALILLACAELARRVFRRAEYPLPLDLLAFFWLLANTLFQLCIGSHWGFRHFPRFAIPAQPALFWALAPYTPRQKWVWLAGIIGVFILAVVSIQLSP